MDNSFKSPTIIMAIAILIVVIFAVFDSESNDAFVSDEPELGEDFLDENGYGYQYVSGAEGKDVHFIGYKDDSLTAIDIPDTAYNKENGRTYDVVGISSYSINWNVEELSIGNNVVIIDKPMLKNGDVPGEYRLSKIHVDGDNPKYDIYSGALVLKSEVNVLVQFPPARVQEEVNLGETELIDAYAFQGAKSIMKVTLSPSINILAKGVFEYCTSLERICVKGEESTYNVLPQFLIVIGSSAFYHCSSLKTIYIGDNVNMIGGNAFEGCSSLEYVYIGATAENIGLSAFSYCSSLKKVEVSEYNSTFTVDKEGEYAGILKRHSTFGTATYIALYPCGLEKKVLRIGNDINGIDCYAFSMGMGNLEEIYFDINNDSVFEGAFAGCQSLKTVHLNSNVFVIDDFAFSLCTSLEKITDYQDVIEIGVCAFNQCTSLVDFTLPNSIINIKSMAFSYSGIEKITIPDTTKKVGYCAFYNSALREVDVEGQPAFEECSLYTENDMTITKNAKLTIPDNALNHEKNITIINKGEWHFPMYNLLGLIICFVILAGMVLIFRKI